MYLRGKGYGIPLGPFSHSEKLFVHSSCIDGYGYFVIDQIHEVVEVDLYLNNYNNECLNAPNVDLVNVNMGYSNNYYIIIYIFDRMQEVTNYECFNLFYCLCVSKAIISRF